MAGIQLGRAREASFREQQKELDSLKQQNENLRMTINTLEQKPGRAEIRTLHVYDKAINLMQKRAPGFAPVWQEVLGVEGLGACRCLFTLGVDDFGVVLGRSTRGVL